VSLRHEGKSKEFVHAREDDCGYSGSEGRGQQLTGRKGHRLMSVGIPEERVSTGFGS
jgi:hypothetical protein